MTSVQDLKEIYQSFCSFGSNRNLATGSSGNLSSEGMEGAKFSKFTKDCKVIDGKNVTSTDVDILFNKVKAKGSRRLDWNEFHQAFQTLAEMRFPGKTPRDAYQSLLHIVSDKGPVARGTIANTNGVYDKLTDTSKYTGSHKNRFDDNGVGMGAAGRDIGQGTLNHSQVVNREKNATISHNTTSSATITNISGPSNNTSVGAGKKRGQTSVITASVENLEIRNNPVKKVDAHISNGSLNKGTSGSIGSLTKATSTTVTKTTTVGARPGTSGNGAGVFDRLTNTSGYTGSHAHRFNADGSGRGLAGRDTASKGNGTTSNDGLAKILRN